jgi:hypothetical protein
MPSGGAEVGGGLGDRFDDLISIWRPVSGGGGEGVFGEDCSAVAGPQDSGCIVEAASAGDSE